MPNTITTRPLESIELGCGCRIHVDDAGELEVAACDSCDRAALERLAGEWHALGSPRGVITLARSDAE